MDAIPIEHERLPAGRQGATGVINLNKPGGITSRAAVDQIARWFRGSKVGHAGTLDPLASGVLIVCVGTATRLVECVQRFPKTYRTTVHLGGRSETLDADGQIEAQVSPPVPTAAAIEGVLARFAGEVEQLPPEYSALKVKGKRAYELARAGHAIALAPRRVRIDRVALLAYDWPLLDLEIDCGSGTYIRSIARDIGDALGCGGYVETLVRTRIGPFHLNDAVDCAHLSAERARLALRPALDAVAGMPRVVLDRLQVAAAARGQRLKLSDLAGALPPAGEVVLLDEHGNLVALAETSPADGWLQPRKVLI